MRRYWIAAALNGSKLSVELILLRNRLFGLLLLAILLAACNSQETAAPLPTLPPEVAAGKQLFQVHCASCHVIEGDTVIVGPSLARVAANAGSRVAGLDARQYIELSILQPDAFLVEGFDNLMPSTLGKQLTGEELDQLVAYLLTLE
jgi:mono/diheme cytochrome c family protein